MKQRLFIAINLDNATKLALAKMIAQLPNSSAINKTKVDNLHLTLQFLGDTEESLIPEIQTILQNTVARYSSLQLSFAQMGAFPNWKYPNVIWVGVKGAHLQELQADLAKQLIKIVPTMDIKTFQPHLTLAKIKYFLPPTEIICLQSLKDKINLSAMPVTNIDLMASTLTSQGAIYTLISRHQFAKYK